MPTPDYHEDPSSSGECPHGLRGPCPWCPQVVEPLDDEPSAEPLDAEPLDDPEDGEPLDEPSGESDDSSASWWDEDEDDEGETAGPKRRAVLYVRVSTQKQATGGLSFDHQRERLEALCKAHEIEVVEVVTEIASTKVAWPAREGGQRCVELLRSGEANALAVLRLDRWVRSVSDVFDLTTWFKRKGWELLLADPFIDTKTAMGELMVTLMSAFAQLERHYIRQRTKEALRQQHRNRRRPIGRVRFGERLECWKCKTRFSPDPVEPQRCRICFGAIKLRPNPPELATMGMILQLHDEGMSQRRIAEELEVARRKTKMGKVEWNHVVVGRIVKKLKKSKKLREKALDYLHREKLEA